MRTERASSMTESWGHSFVERATSDVKIATEFVLGGHGKVSPNLNAGQILPGVPETVNTLGVIVVGTIHAEDKWPNGHGPIDFLMKDFPLRIKKIANAWSNNHVAFGSGHPGHPFHNLSVGPGIENEFHRSVRGQTSIQSLDASLHSTYGAVEEKLVDGRHTIGGETRVTSFPELNTRVI